MLNNYYLTVKLMSKLIQWLKFKYRFSTRAVLGMRFNPGLYSTLFISTAYVVCFIRTLSYSEPILALHVRSIDCANSQNKEKRLSTYITINLSAFRKPWSIKTIDKSNPFVPDLFQKFQSALMCQNRICTDSRCIAY